MRGYRDPVSVGDATPLFYVRVTSWLNTTPVSVITAGVTKKCDSTGWFGGESQHGLVYAHPNGAGVGQRRTEVRRIRVPQIKRLRMVALVHWKLEA